jgi:two-component system, NtrC family, sensor histidine kinase PilS
MRHGSLTVNRSLVQPVGAATPSALAGAPGGFGLPAETFDLRLKWLIGLRPAVLTIVLGTALALDIPASRQLSAELALLLLGLCYALSAMYAATRSYIMRWPWLVDTQLLIDVVTISIIVLFTGGFQSNFVPLYVLPILAGSVIRLARGGLVIAGASATIFALLVASQFGLVVPQPQEWWGVDVTSALPSPRVAFYSLGLHTIGFVSVAKLTGYLAEKLHRTDLRLQRASTTLADMKAYNQHVIDSLTGGLAATDAHGRVIMFNRAAETITGESAANVLGRTVLEVLQIPQAVRRVLREVSEPGRPRRSEYSFTMRNGRSIDIGLSIGPLIGTAGQVGHLFTFQDLTEFKRREREEQRQKRMAAVGEMAAGIAHEIRNPLASMSGSMQLLRQELHLNSEQTQLFDIVLRESDRLNDTIRNFLAYARPQQPKTTTVDLRRVVSETAQLIRNNPECQSKHQVEVELASAELLCEGDEAQMRQIVWNLATNGIRAMPEGGTLVLAAGPSSPEATTGMILSVRDHGVGIAEDDLDRIFQPFHGGFAKGAGLGLAIVHRIVTDRVGEIRVSSQVGRGTTVDIHWPVRQATPEPVRVEETWAPVVEVAS